MYNILLTAAETQTSLFDSNVVKFVTDSAKDILGIMTTPPLGTFLTIGILGAVVGLVATIVSLVKRR